MKHPTKIVIRSCDDCLFHKAIGGDRDRSPYRYECHHPHKRNRRCVRNHNCDKGLAFVGCPLKRRPMLILLGIEADVKTSNS
jgi:hypothetical protein